MGEAATHLPLQVQSIHRDMIAHHIRDAVWGARFHGAYRQRSVKHATSLSPTEGIAVWRGLPDQGAHIERNTIIFTCIHALCEAVGKSPSFFSRYG